MAVKKTKAKDIKKKVTGKKVKDNKIVEAGQETFVVATSTPLKDDSKTTLVTKEGLEALKEELMHLEGTRRREIAARIKEAVSYGDLSENSEYEEAKNEQAFVEGRIIQLTEQIKYAQIIDEESQSSAKGGQLIQVGNKVKIKGVSGKVAGNVYEYTIVGTTEADPLNGKISNESPVGMALLNARMGEKIDVKVPAGMVTFQILSVA
ncbi:transcription elongation factor GreA [Candidatus Peregrinibacteria bacterium]|nr:transcription elongation factor GreA [Candidatus Peregrinibacteria bacterium]